MKAHVVSLFLIIHMNCPDSLLRNKAKNALSLAVPIAPGKAGQIYKKLGYARLFPEKLQKTMQKVLWY